MPGRVKTDLTPEEKNEKYVREWLRILPTSVLLQELERRRTSRVTTKREKAMEDGARLRKLRIQLKMTQAQLAMKLGITQAHLCLCERGKRYGAAELIRRIEDDFKRG